MENYKVVKNPNNCLTVLKKHNVNYRFNLKKIRGLGEKYASKITFQLKFKGMLMYFSQMFPELAKLSHCFV